MSQVVEFAHYRRPHARRIYFNRPELTLLLQLYSRHVARGDWRDYAIDHAVGMAVFSVFRHSHDRPLLAIVKTHGHGNRPAEYALMVGPRKVRRSGSLMDLVEAFERAPEIVTER